MPKSETKAAEVREGLRAYLDECAQNGEQPAASTSEWYHLMERRLGMDYSGNGYRNMYAWEKKFRAQVLAGLNKLAEAGVLVKKTDRTRDVVFLLPAEAKRRSEIAAEHKRAEDERRQRFADIKGRLNILGITALPSSYPVQLDATSWERLLNWAEAGIVRAPGEYPEGHL